MCESLTRKRIYQACYYLEVLGILEHQVYEELPAVA